LFMLPVIAARIAQELNVHPNQVLAAVALLDDGATVPFVARYRKEATGGLDDTHLRHLEERLGYLRELEERREAVLASVREQGKLTPELDADLVRPTPSSAWKTSTCPTSPSAAPRPRSPGKRAAAPGGPVAGGPRCSTRMPRPPLMWTPTKAWRT
jgi:uncharacterized protein